VLSRQDLVAVQRDVGALPYGYFTDSETLVGQQLKRPVRPGDILSPAMVAPAPAVERGQTVWIAAESGGIKVTMKGEALADGAIGERVPVRNLSSKRVLEAEVISANLVRVAL
jgi:flagella basal body P-ring formation protein FlgA